MNLLLDTHTLLWWVTGDSALSNRASVQISRSENVLVSAVTAWELAIKASLGRLPSAIPLLGDFDTELAKDGFHSLAITSAHGIRAGSLPGPHRDPFDRMLIAQAQAENLAIVSNDEVFDRYGIRRLW